MFERDLKDHRLSGYEFGTTYLVWSSQFNVDRNENPTMGAYSIDLFAQTAWKWGSQELVVKIALNNLLDRYYLNHLSAYRQLNLPEQGRNISVLIQLPIGK
jgi:iron complex outermembrane receptor protein